MKWGGRQVDEVTLLNDIICTLVRCSAMTVIYRKHGFSRHGCVFTELDTIGIPYEWMRRCR